VSGSEDPCYLGARAAFELAGAAIGPVPVDQEGIRVDFGVRRYPGARVACLTPSHQYPTGVALSLDRRVALIEWAARNNAWIVEDDYDGEIRYEGQPLTALYSLDSHARVLYTGTLNKSVFVSLRVAFPLVPEELVEPLANLRTQMDGFTPAVRQMATSPFMDEGHFASHLRRMRALLGDYVRAVAASGSLDPRVCGTALRRCGKRPTRLSFCLSLRGVEEALWDNDLLDHPLNPWIANSSGISLSLRISTTVSPPWPTVCWRSRAPSRNGK
jgi:hypothetical protein